MNTRRTFIKRSGVAALISFGIAAPATSFGAEPIRVGAVLSITGAAAFLGDPELKTLKMYIDEINEKGGVLDRKLELIHYDDASDANKANAFAKRLVEQDKVDFIVGGTTTGSTMSMVPIVEKAGVPFMSLAGATVIVDPVKKWVFKASTTDKIAAERVLHDMQEKGYKKIALISDTAGFGQSGKKQTEIVVNNYNIDIISNETYGAKDTDMTPQLTKIKNTNGVQAIFVFGFGQGPAIVSKNIKQLGIDLPIYHAHGVGSDEFIKTAGPSAEGMKALAPALMVADSLKENDPQKLVVTSYNGKYEKQWGEGVSMFGGQAYDNFFIVIDAIKRAGTTDKDKVRDEIEKTSKFIGTGGEVNMSNKDHMGMDMWSLRMIQVKNGRWVLAD